MKGTLLELLKNDENCTNIPHHWNQVKEELEEKETQDLILYDVQSPTNNSKEKKHGHRRVNEDGGISYKKISTLNIMESFQLGLKRSMSGLAASPDRDVLMVDFMTVESISFTSGDSGKEAEFIFKTYAPVAFRHFRDLFCIESSYFVSSFCDNPLLELPNPGASGSVLYLTLNDTFITKTVQHKEAEFLQKLLPGYYLNINQNPRTLLPKFFGLYCYRCGYKNIRLVVMNNVLPSKLKIHYKYDLKGSTLNRKASATECKKDLPTFKDLDFISHHPGGLYLSSDDYNTLLTTIEKDCRVLESFQIMDYSLLLGIHNINKVKMEKRPNNKEGQQCAFEDGDNKSSGDCIPPESSIQTDPNIPKSNATDNFESSGNLTCDQIDQKKIDKTHNSFLSGIPAIQDNGDELLLFVGIIDILQSYGVRKRLEHVWKSIVHDSESVSVHNPSHYSERFQQFLMNTVFKTTPTSQNKHKSKLKQVV